MATRGVKAPNESSGDPSKTKTAAATARKDQMSENEQTCEDSRRRASVNGYTAADVFYNVRVNRPTHRWNKLIVGLLTNGGVVALVLRGNETEYLKWCEVEAV